jgi:TPR repeat protein
LYAEGKGVKKDPARAKQLYEKACAAGDERGCKLRGGGFYLNE